MATSHLSDHKPLCDICLKRNSKVLTSKDRTVCFPCKEVFARFSKLQELGNLQHGELLLCKCTGTSPNSPSDFKRICQACRYKKCLDYGVFSETQWNGAIDFKQLKCSVCLRPSSGYHYGAVTCDSCKSFFIRTVQHRARSIYRCENDDLLKQTPKSMLEESIVFDDFKKCHPSGTGKFTCKFCRFQSCLRAGMSVNAFRRGRHSYYIRDKINQNSASTSVVCRPPRLSDDTILCEFPSRKETTISGSFADTAKMGSQNTGLLNLLAMESEQQGSHQPATAPTQWKPFLDYLSQPPQSSPYIWVYGSARHYINIDSYESTTIPVEEDPLCLVRRFFRPPVPNIFCNENDTESFLMKLVPLMKILQNISLKSVRFVEGMSPMDAWQATCKNIIEVGRHSLAVAKMLPHFERLSTSDRKVLFAEAFFPLWVAEQVMNYNEKDKNLSGLFHSQMSESSKIYLSNAFLVSENIEQAGINAAQSIKQANLCIVEYALMIGVIFFDPNVAALQQPNIVKEIHNEYAKVHESFIRNDYITILERENCSLDLDLAVMNRIDRLFGEMTNLRIVSTMLTNSFLNIGDKLSSLLDDCPFLKEILKTVSRKSL